MDGTHLVALSARLATTLLTAGRRRAVAGDVAGLTAPVAGLGILLALRAIAAHVALIAAVVAKSIR